ncbi:peptidase M13 [Flavipsychrobacter stenotrophus]|uniref:Peptidase M13 n=1 Tax=Flavipsychrobacter stenotrophus TaxID=2077091 RepID=A0A2S7T0Q7_9BACT|nr:M13 family metallopeptidase [Flavipsychrobacter stenotrophus]PQJ12770.1 peptidase M13 [Flavipsychrobacter stenotrophus]
MYIKNTLLAGAAVVAMASCQQPGGKTEVKDNKFIDLANMDTTIHPGDNFFMYANGAWLKANPVPGDQSRWGSFNILAENNLKALHTILDSAAGIKDAAKGSAVQKVGDFYRTGMDSVAIEKAGITPLKEVMARIDAIKDVNGLMAELTLEQTEGIGSAFGFGISPDDKNVTKEICQFGPGGLGMPGKEYYFDKDERTAGIREAYKAYIPQILTLMGTDSNAAKKDGAQIYNLEQSLASAWLTRVEMRDPIRLYNKFNIDGISKLTPGLDWKMLLAGLKVTGQDSMIISIPKFYTELAKQMKATPIEVWKKYLKFHLGNSMAPYLTHDFVNARFALYGTKMRGQKEQSARWKRVLNEVDGSIGDLLGQLYVDKYFKPEAKKRMMELLDNLQAAYSARIQNLEWMSPETKKLATAKLNAIVKKIGYPDKWKDYGAITIVNNDYVKNVMVASAWEYNYELSKLGKPVDRAEWGMTPPTVNAYYNPAFNEIVFPAGILQFPFFDGDADDAVNYGGIGAVIGHEITHGFDDQGRLYDATGNLNNWWTSVDSANFVKKADVMVMQFNQVIVIDTFHANGSLTEGENLADLGGINIAYEAFKKTKQGQDSTKINGFTPDQRFFLSWAQVWRANTKPEELANRLKTDPHSASEQRCNLPVSNVAAWYKAFNIKPTDKMYRPENERARVW